MQQEVVLILNVGGLDMEENITFLGRLYSSLPLDIKLSRLLLLGKQYYAVLRN